MGGRAGRFGTVGAMFGTLRLFLAIMVVWYHVGAPPSSVQTGVVAVAVFFIISGYVMTAAVESRFSGPGGWSAFYRDRVLRLWPQYLFYLALYGLAITLFGGSKAFHSGAFTPWVALGYLTILPLCFFPFSADLSLFMIIPQAWSLGTELCFYALLPWMLRARWAIPAISVVSIGVYCLATHGVIPRDPFTYRVLPGCLVFFLIGHFLHERQTGRLAALLTALSVNMLLLAWTGAATADYNLDLYIAAMGGSVAVGLLARQRPNRLDERLGALSYGCYLVHFLMIFIGERFGLFADLNVLSTALAVTTLSVLAGYLSEAFVERPAQRLRRALRQDPASVHAGIRCDRLV